MPSWLSELPFVVALVVLATLAFLRGQATYGIARWATQRAVRPDDGQTAWRGRARRWLDGPEAVRGRRLLERWGLPLIPVAYLTVGLQTVILASAGVLRISWLRFTLAQLPGVLAWGVIYATIGFAAWEAAIGAAAASPAAAGLLGLAVTALVTWLLRRRLSGRGESGAAQDDHRD